MAATIAGGTTLRTPARTFRTASRCPFSTAAARYAACSAPTRCTWAMVWCPHSHSPKSRTRRKVSFGPNQFDGAIARDVPFDGIIGLAYPKVSSLKVKPVFDAIMEKKLVPQSVFSFYLGRSSDARPAGELVLGGINHERFKGSMHYVSVSKKRHWEFQMDRVQAGSDKRFCVGGCWTVVDSGSSLIEGPQEEIDRINKVIGAQKTEHERYLVDCKKVSKLPKLIFTIGGRQHTLKGVDYIVKLQTSNNKVRCYAGFGTTDDYGTKKPLWILGQVFMRKFYTVFDRNADRIGFAEAR
ncbi:cathepsin D [Rhipicephalus sanguineus]|uniref:cathepsin D n=1 Tax=Rhipicephalus sanguineus TaxID=34632 RepID=UPI0018953B6D|nr:cathepsin D [Rhipicephalus sanguineus]